MDEWKEANVGQAAQDKEPELSTDDLIFMIGEGAIKEHNAGKIITYLRQQITAQQKLLLKEQSLHKSVEDNAQKEKSLQNRIVQLEDQAHKVAIERDAELKAKLIALQELEELKKASLKTTKKKK